MFICGLCFIYTKPGEKSKKIVTILREKIYPFRSGANVFIARDEPKRKVVSDDPGGHGLEIAREVSACKTCAAKPPVPEIITLADQALPEVRL